MADHTPVCQRRDQVGGQEDGGLEGEGRRGGRGEYAHAESGA